MRQTRVIIILLVQLGLLGIELAARYDTSVRQIALAITNLGTTAGLLWLDGWRHRRGQRLSWVTVLVVLGGVWIDALGNFQHLYGQFWWYDRFSHTLGGMAVSAIFIDLYLAWQRSGKLAVSSGFAIWTGFLLGQFVAAMYEVTEWLGDWWFATERVRSAFDAPRDLFFNLVGGLLVVTFFWLIKAKK